jgi:N-acetylneuraminate epimerase
MLKPIILISLIFTVATSSLLGGDNLKWKQLESIPDALGVAGPVCGTYGKVLIVAGGANFPDAPPWNNGRKVWHDSVYVLESEDGGWKKVSRLPRPIGYSVSVSIPNGLGMDPGVAYVGGSNAEGHYSDCGILRWKQGRLDHVELPALPRACANASGAILDDTIFIAGGIEHPDSTQAMHQFWALNLRQHPLQWQELPAWPGAERMLAVAAVQDGAFYLCSGVSLSAGPDGKPQRTYLRDAYRYQPKVGWTRIADLPRPAVAAASPAPSIGQSRFLVLGGDDGSLVNFRPLGQHPGFPKSILAYSTITDTWTLLSGQLPASHVTTSAVLWQGNFVIPSGELRPGVRSPEVWSISTILQK